MRTILQLTAAMLAPGVPSVALALAFAACADPAGNDPNIPDYVAPACSISLPESCPKTPSYSQDIAPLIQRSCLPCHTRGGVASNHNLSTYTGLTRQGGTTAILEIKQCLMPPTDAGPDAALTLDERLEILQWFTCLAPNN